LGNNHGQRITSALASRIGPVLSLIAVMVLLFAVWNGIASAAWNAWCWR
jgi:hypothetical protein